MTDSLFSDLDIEKNDPPEVSMDPSKKYLEELVGEGKKFKDIEELAKGKYYADEMVKIQNRRLDDLRAEYLKLRDDNMAKAKLEELIEQLQNKQLASSDEPKAKEVEKPFINVDEIENRIFSKLDQRESSKRETDNFNLVKNKLEQRFGKNYKEAVLEQIEELGITEQDLNVMARKNPKVLLRTLGLDQPQQQDPFNAPPRTQQRNDSFAPKGAPKRTWSYYENMRKVDKNAWLDPKVAVQMQKDAIDLGDAFYDGNFYQEGLHER